MTPRCYNCGSSHIINVRTPELGPLPENRKPPYGFINIGRKFKFDDGPRGQVLVYILKSHVEGWSYREIASFLNTSSPPILSPSGGEWSHTSVWRVAHRGRRLIHLIPTENVLKD